MNTEKGISWKLGMFVIAGITIFAVAIFFIGKQKNLFGSTFRLASVFKTVSGLKVGNNVRFSGINVGTVDAIDLITDTSVKVTMVIQKEVKQFLRKDGLAGISSDGLMGDKVVMLYSGTSSAANVVENDLITAKDPIEMDDIMVSVKSSVDNISIITDQLAEFTFKLNNGKGALSKLMNDEKFGKSLDATMDNLQTGTKGLSDNMEAAKSNFLLKGFFNKKKKEEAKKAAELQKAKDQKAEEERKKKEAALELKKKKSGTN